MRASLDGGQHLAPVEPRPERCLRVEKVPKKGPVRQKLKPHIGASGPMDGAVHGGSAVLAVVERKAGLASAAGMREWDSQQGEHAMLANTKGGPGPDHCNQPHPHC